LSGGGGITQLSHEEDNLIHKVEKGANMRLVGLVIALTVCTVEPAFAGNWSVNAGGVDVGVSWSVDGNGVLTEKIDAAGASSSDTFNAADRVPGDNCKNPIAQLGISGVGRVWTAACAGPTVCLNGQRQVGIQSSLWGEILGSQKELGRFMDNTGSNNIILGPCQGG